MHYSLWQIYFDYLIPLLSLNNWWASFPPQFLLILTTTLHLLWNISLPLRLPFHFSLSSYLYFYIHKLSTARMGEKLDKFLLLMWKNWLLQYRRPIQTAVEIVVPVLFSILLVVIRRLVDPEQHEALIFKPFCTIPMYDEGSAVNMLCNPGNTLDLDDKNLRSFRIFNRLGAR